VNESSQGPPSCIVHEHSKDTPVKVQGMSLQLAHLLYDLKFTDDLLKDVIVDMFWWSVRSQLLKVLHTAGGLGEEDRVRGDEEQVWGKRNTNKG